MVGDGQWLHDEARKGNRGQIIMSAFFFELETIEVFLSKRVPCQTCYIPLLFLLWRGQIEGGKDTLAVEDNEEQNAVNIQFKTYGLRQTGGASKVTKIET